VTTSALSEQKVKGRERTDDVHASPQGEEHEGHIPFTVLFAPLSLALPVALLIPNAHQHASTAQHTTHGSRRPTAPTQCLAQAPNTGTRKLTFDSVHASSTLPARHVSIQQAKHAMQRRTWSGNLGISSCSVAGSAFTSAWLAVICLSCSASLYHGNRFSAKCFRWRGYKACRTRGRRLRPGAARSGTFAEYTPLRPMRLLINPNRSITSQPPHYRYLRWLPGSPSLILPNCKTASAF